MNHVELMRRDASVPVNDSAEQHGFVEVVDIDPEDSVFFKIVAGWIDDRESTATVVSKHIHSARSRAWFSGNLVLFYFDL